MYEPTTSSAEAPAVRLGRPGTPLEPSRIVEALAKGRGLVLRATVAAGVIGAVLAATVVPREYAAQVTLLVGEEASNGPASPEPARHLKTIADSVKLPRTLDRVRERLGLAESLETLGRAVQVEASPNANLVLVTATRRSASEAAHLADATTEEFVRSRREATLEHLEEERAHLQHELETARAALESARAKREAFRREHHLSDVPTEIRVALEQAARHAADSEISVASLEAEQARIGLLEGVAAKEPALTMIAEQHVTPEAMKLGELKAQIAAESGRLDAQHPRLQSLAAQAQALEANLAATHEPLVASRTMAQNPHLETIKHEVRSAASAKAAAERRGVALATFSKVARERVAELAELQAPLAVLDGELARAQAHVDDVEGRLAKVVEATHAPSADVAVLSPAVVPGRPLKPTRRMTALAAPLVGVALGAIAALIRGLRGLAAESPAEIAFWTNKPVLAAVRGASAEAVGGLRADLGPAIAEWSGTTLLVVLSDDELPLARSVAELMPESAVRIASLGGRPQLDGLRRDRRASDRALLLVRSGSRDFRSLSRAGAALDGTDGGPSAVVVFGLRPELVSKRDRVGAVDAFIRHPIATRGART